MVRFCIVPNCNNNDTNILCHRFPRNPELQQKWLQSLNIESYKAKQIDKHVVCSMHFDAKDYRNIESNFLNITACPKLEGIIPRVKFVIGMKRKINKKRYMNFSANVIKLSSSSSSSQSSCNNEEGIGKRKKQKLSTQANKKRNCYESTFLIKQSENDIEVNDRNVEIIYDVELENNESYRKYNDLEVATINSKYSVKYDEADDSEDITSKGTVTNDFMNDNESFDKLDNSSSNFEDLVEIEDYYLQEESFLTCSVACQTNEDNDNAAFADDDVYSKLTKSQLIEMLRKSKEKITELETKVAKIEKAHDKLMESVKLIQTIL